MTSRVTNGSRDPSMHIFNQTIICLSALLPSPLPFPAAIIYYLVVIIQSTVLSGTSRIKPANSNTSQQLPEGPNKSNTHKHIHTQLQCIAMGVFSKVFLRLTMGGFFLVQWQLTAFQPYLQQQALLKKKQHQLPVMQCLESSMAAKRTLLSCIQSTKIFESKDPNEAIKSERCAVLGRRESIVRTTASVAMVLLGGLSVAPPPILAATDATDSTSPTTTTTTAADILKSLGSIPTFVLVEGDSGVPFMIFNGENAATGYFFLSYNIAEQALRDAREKDKQQSGGAANDVWNAAQVRVVPLSIAMQLALSSQQRAAVNEEKGVKGKRAGIEMLGIRNNTWIVVSISIARAEGTVPISPYIFTAIFQISN
jgi:hypothetical protein